MRFLLRNVGACGIKRKMKGLRVVSDNGRPVKSGRVV